MTELPPANLAFLFAAFAVAWLGFFIYAGYMSWRRQSVQRDLEDLRQPADASDGADGRGDTV